MHLQWKQSPESLPTPNFFETLLPKSSPLADAHPGGAVRPGPLNVVRRVPKRKEPHG